MDLKPGKNSVSYPSDGEKVAAHLYLPEDYVDGEKRSAIIVNPPTSSVKEQTTGSYAEKLSKKGFITMALDPKEVGESEGESVLLLSTYKIADDIRNGLSYLRTLDQVDVESTYNLSFG